MFRKEVEKRGGKSLMPAECYTDPDYKWGYGANEERGAVIFGEHLQPEHV
jgi:hypothetical protein